jgi:hypothetical protein
MFRQFGFRNHSIQLAVKIQPPLLDLLPRYLAFPDGQ